MNTIGMLALRVFLASIAAFHMLVGAGLNVSRDLPQAMAGYYGAVHVNWTPELVYMLHPLGAFMFVMGTLGVVAAIAPLQQRAIVYGFAALFILRGLQRIAFHQDTVDLFGITPTRNMVNMAFFVGMGIALLCLHVYVARQARAAQAQTP